LETSPPLVEHKPHKKKHKKHKKSSKQEEGDLLGLEPEPAAASAGHDDAPHVIAADENIKVRCNSGPQIRKEIPITVYR
jgi:hypothetical protein